MSKVLALVVDDTPEIRELFREMFEFLGCRSILAEDAVQATEVFKVERNIRIVLSDYYMGREDLSGEVLHRNIEKMLHKRGGVFILVHGGMELPAYFRQQDVFVLHKSEDSQLDRLRALITPVVNRQRARKSA